MFCLRIAQKYSVAYNIVMIKSNKKNLGIVYILLSAFFFAFMNFFVKSAGDVPVAQKVFFRNVVAVFFSLIFLARDPKAFRTGKGHIPDLFLRALIGTMGVFGNFYALSNGVSVADASILNKLSPFFAIIFSIFILKEKPAKAEWAAVILAFIGALFVVQPKFDSSVLPALCGVFGGLCAGVAYTFVRKMGKDGVNGNLIVFVFSCFSCLVTLPVLLFNYTPMSWNQLGFLLLAGIAATGGQVFVTKAYTCAPAKEISVYDYSIVLFAAILDWVFLQIFPNVWSFIGYVVIIFAAVGNWILRRRREGRAERVGQEKNRASDSPADSLSNESKKEK